MSEDTNKQSAAEQEQEQPVDSQIGRVSVRSIIALILVGTVCLMFLSNTVADLIVSIGKGIAPAFNVPEPLYSGFMVAIGAYLGKSLSKLKV